MGAELCLGPGRVIWVAHRTELVQQAAERLRASGLCVGEIRPCAPYEPLLPVQVGTIQTLLARELRPQAELVVLDECHHYALGTELWSTFAAEYPNALLLGLTATPERQDGSPLGDVFSGLVVAASYSELLLDGYLCPCHVYAPEPGKGSSSDWGMDPVEAYNRFAPGTRAIAFFDRVARATEWAEKFGSALVVSGDMPADERAKALASFRRGDTRVLCNVAVLTEGVDLPEAETVILGRRPTHASLFLQIVGRVLRPSVGKPHATLIDLVDATSEHGYPTDDREYSLDGEAITRSAKSDTRRCQECLAIYPRSNPACPQCGAVPVVQPPPQIKIWSSTLALVYDGANTRAEHKHQEWLRLKSLGFGLIWSLREYGKLFGSSPPAGSITEEDKRREFFQLKEFAQKRGYKPGYAAARFKEAFGKWPPRHW